MKFRVGDKVIVRMYLGSPFYNEDEFGTITSTENSLETKGYYVYIPMRKTRSHVRRTSNTYWVDESFLKLDLEGTIFDEI